MAPLEGIHVVSLAINVPGPVAAAGLRDLGARVTKIEPPAGDPLAQFSPAWYDRLCADMEVTALDLKSTEGMAALTRRLRGADLLLTATRPAALKRLGLDWPRLQELNPALCHVGIVGHAAPHENVAGHDLTYQAALGTLEPPKLPRVLLADMAGAQQAVTAALGLLMARERSQGAGQAWVALADAAESFAVPLREGMTAPGGVLGNGVPQYNIYATRDGYVALAALEPHFLQALLEAVDEVPLSTDSLGRFFSGRSSDDWVAWGNTRGIPVAAIR